MIIPKFKYQKIVSLTLKQPKWFTQKQQSQKIQPLQQKQTKQKLNQIFLNDSADSILKRYRQHQGWVFNNPNLFDWLNRAIKDSCVGNTTKFNDLLKLTSNIHISKYDSWRMLHQLSIQLRNLFNWGKFTTKDNIKPIIKPIDLIKLAKNFNYQFHQDQDQKFIQFIRSKTGKITSEKQLTQYSQIIQVSLGQNKVLKLFQGKQLQYFVKKVLEKQNITINQEFSMANIIKEGLQSQSWSDLFLQQVLQIIKKRVNNSQQSFGSIKNAIKFTKYQLFPDQIQLGSREQLYVNSETEDKIGIILKELEYNVVFGQKIFNYQVDFLIGKKFIIQYNGIHHYITNSQSPIQTIKSNWKRRTLQKRGYHVFVIPFYEWKQLKNIHQMKRFLITKLQNQIIHGLTNKTN